MVPVRDVAVVTATEVPLVLQAVTEGFIDRLTDAPARALRELRVDEILRFLKNVGRNWKSREYVRRRLYVRDLVEMKGYSDAMANNEADWIALLLCSDYRLYDVVATELGSWRALDEWIAREEVYARAYPVGTVLHLAPGNVPLSSVVSVLRSIVTKNCSVVKTSAADPFTPLALVQSFSDIDPDHPVTRSLSIVYWPSNDDAVGRAVARRADAIIAWGGTEALSWARSCAGPKTELICFGAKRSVGLVGRGADLDRAARAVALDASLYDQRACFSLRQVFVERAAVPAFLEKLATALRHLGGILPPGTASFDERALQGLSRQEWSYEALVVEAGLGWAVVLDSTPSDRAHCLGRTVFVHPVDDLADILPHVDSSVQTVGVMPEQAALDLRDALAERGVSRVVELGLHNIFRLGGAHDGLYALQRLVRWCNHELPARRLVKGINVEIDQTDFVEYERLADFAP